MSVAMSRPTAHGWIAGAALAWNLLGLLMFVMQAAMTPEQIAALPPADRAVHEATPGWVLAAFGVAVAAGVAGSIGLWLRKPWAAPVLALSLAGIVVQLAGTYLITPAFSTSGVPGLILPIVLVGIAVALLRYARRLTP